MSKFIETAEGLISVTKITAIERKGAYGHIIVLDDGSRISTEPERSSKIEDFLTQSMMTVVPACAGDEAYVIYPDEDNKVAEIVRAKVIAWEYGGGMAIPITTQQVLPMTQMLVINPDASVSDPTDGIWSNLDNYLADNFKGYTVKFISS